MPKITIHFKQYYFNYNNTSSICFNLNKMSVWDNAGKVQYVSFNTEEECKKAQEKLENGLINGYVFIELSDNN